MPRASSKSLTPREILAREVYPFGPLFDPSRAGYRVALVYANTYHVAMSNLGFQQVYRMLNEMDGVVCERVFSPDGRGKGVRTLETGSHLGGFDLVAFSSPYETDYPAILEVLDEGGIPLRSADRTGRHPIIIMGGICPSYNPEPLAPFVDAAVVGEAEEVLAEIMAVLVEGKGRARETVLADLARVPGVYVPSGYEIDPPPPRTAGMGSTAWPRSGLCRGFPIGSISERSATWKRPPRSRGS